MRFRRRRKNKYMKRLILMLLVLVSFSVGYAYLNKSLSIEGTTTVAKTTWNVRFQNIQVFDNNAIVETAPTLLDNATKVSFAINLDKPGDSYGFTVDVVNSGTVDAKLSSISLTDELQNKTNYLDYSLTYIDGVEIQEGDALKAGEHETIKFKAYFKKDITASDLESDDTVLNLVLTATYSQSDGTEVAVNHPVTCRKATTLHTETCSRTDSYGCIAKGYANGDTITYGHTNGTSLVNGQSGGYALDCDVSGNGDYERFYYVSDLYTGTENGVDQFDSDYAVLIYHKNIGTAVAYNSANENWHGPVTLLSSLPTRSTWANENINLKSTSRTIVNEQGAQTTNNDSNTIENPFNYTDRVARILTTHEIDKALGSTSRITSGYLDNAEYLMEDSAYSKESGCSGGACYYWLETPHSSASAYAWSMRGHYRRLSYGSASDAVYCGARPAVEIPKVNISLK